MAPSCSLLDVLSPAERAGLMARAVPRRLVREECLYLMGEAPRRVYLISSGVIKLTARTSEGRLTILGLGLGGDIVGDIAAVDGLPQPLDAIAATRSDVLGIASDALVDVLAGNPAAALEVARGLARRSRWMAETAAERAASAVPARLAGRLLDLADLVGRAEGDAIELDLPLGQEDLARLAGMCRESACKTLRQFKSRGWLDYGRSGLRILRPDALARIRCSGRL